VAFVPFPTKVKTEFPRIVELPASKSLGSAGRFFVLCACFRCQGRQSIGVDELSEALSIC
jgi:hypothetical protein